VTHPGSYRDRHLQYGKPFSWVLNLAAGEQVVLIDGDPAGSGADRYPTIPVSMTIIANQLNELPYVPHLHTQHQRFTAIHPTQKTVATDPDLPGVALDLERGNDIIGWDGRAADRVSIRTVPADRLPVRPLPPGLRASSVYMFYFGKRGGWRAAAAGAVRGAERLGVEARRAG
jgi:hypothetical protein